MNRGKLPPKSCTSKMKKKIFFCRISEFYERNRFFRLTDRVKDFFLHFLALRDWQFHRICFVIKGLKYSYTSAPLMPRISGKIANCRI